MTFQEFRSNPEKVRELRQALEMPIVQEALQTLNSPDAPRFNEVLGDISPTFACIRLGSILGYQDTLKDFLLLGTQPKSNEPIENDYAGETET